MASPAVTTPLLRGAFSKFDEDARLAFGWASVVAEDGETVIDKQGDALDLPSLEAAVYGYVEDSRQVGEMHEKLGVGRLVESFVSTPDKLAKMGLATDALPVGVWMGFRVTDDQVWAGVKSGKYPMFSIGGVGEREDM